MGCVTNRFTDVVVAREQVEDTIREGKLNGSTDKFKKPNFRKKDRDVYMINSGSYPPKHKPHQPAYQTSPYSMSLFYPCSYPSRQSQPRAHTPFSVNNISFPNTLVGRSPDISQRQFDRLGEEIS